MWRTTTTTFERFAEENHQPLPAPEDSGFDFPRMYRAYLACRQNKRNKLSALAFELNLEENLLGLVEELRERRYQPSTSICFYTQKPKAREIFAAAFRDRIVHHLVYQELEPVWERIFIYHSYACRPDKGTHNAANALQKFLRRATANGKRRAYYLKMDIKNFFMTIDRRRLFEMLAARCNDPELLWLLRVIVFHDPTTDYELQDRGNLRQSLPPHKSLFNAAPYCGLAIGNLTSQFFANVYLNALDQFVKHVLKCRFYARYVDDLVLVDSDLRRLRLWEVEVSNFVLENLRLAINEKATRLGPVAGGVDFAGFIVRHNYMLVRRRVVGNLKETLCRAKQKLVSETPTYRAYHFDHETLEACQATVNSYLGHFKHAQTRKCVRNLWRKFPFVKRFFSLSSNKLLRADRPLRHKFTLRDQVRWLHRHFSDYVCLIEVGCYFEAFETDAQRLAELLGLKLLQNWRGFSCGCGFPKKLLLQMLVELKRQRVPVVLVCQTGRELHKAKERLPELILEYPDPEPKNFTKL